MAEQNPYIDQLLGSVATGFAAPGNPAIAAAIAAGSPSGQSMPSWLDPDEIQAALQNAPAGTNLTQFGYLRTAGDVPGTVYMGDADSADESAMVGATPHVGDQGKTGYVIPVQQGSEYLTVKQAGNLPYSWSADELQAQINHAIDLGLLEPGANIDDYMSDVWTKAVNRAALTYNASQGENKMSPFDAIDLYGSELQGGEGGSGGFTGSHSTTSRSVNEMSEGQAWSVLKSTLQQALGRDPSDQELRNFTYKMGKLASRNPTISHTVTSYKNGRATGSSTHTKTGFTGDDAAEAAYEEAQASPEYGAYQSASTYFNAAMSALGGIGDVG